MLFKYMCMTYFHDKSFYEDRGTEDDEDILCFLPTGLQLIVYQ